MYKHFFKRFFDFWVALFFVLLSSPLLIITAIWLHFANKGAGAWFLQERPGLHGKIFKIIKFKTMTDERDAEGNDFVKLILNNMEGKENQSVIGQYDEDVIMMMYDDVVIKRKSDLMSGDFPLL